MAWVLPASQREGDELQLAGRHCASMEVALIIALALLHGGGSLLRLAHLAVPGMGKLEGPVWLWEGGAALTRQEPAKAWMWVGAENYSLEILASAVGHGRASHPPKETWEGLWSLGPSTESSLHLQL